MPVAIVCFRAGRFGFWCALLGAESDSCGENSRWKCPTSRQVRYILENRGTVLEKGRRGRVYTPPFFGHGRVKVGVDQSAVSVSRSK